MKHDLGLLLILTLLGCSGEPTPNAGNVLLLATTTSTQDSGLLDVLLPAFQAESGIEVRAVAVGSGQALELGRRGDADVLLTHSPKAEEEFISEGFGTDRRPVMHNDFVLLGPASDSAHVAGDSSIVEALRKVAESQSQFISRGDDSGTHVRELQIWDNVFDDEATKAEELASDWYLESGSGMAQTLRIAFEKQAYTLSDRSTFLTYEGDIDLVVLCELDPLLLNHYSVIVVSRERHPHVHTEAAEQFADFLTEGAGRDIISTFGVEEYGQPLFVPDP